MRAGPFWCAFRCRYVVSCVVFSDPHTEHVSAQALCTVASLGAFICRRGEKTTIKERWEGIKRGRTDFQPTPYYRVDRHGNSAPPQHQAEAMADYLEAEQLGLRHEPLPEWKKQ